MTTNDLQFLKLLRQTLKSGLNDYETLCEHGDEMDNETLNAMVDSVLCSFQVCISTLNQFINNEQKRIIANGNK